MQTLSNHPATPPATDRQSFRGKTVLVTGAGSGIGRAAALRFARDGTQVVLAGRRADALNAVAHEVEQAGGLAASIVADIRDEASIAHLVTTIVERFGALDAAFNNAGINGRYGELADLDAADFDEVFATNTRGTFLLLKHEVQAMRRLGRGGAIVNNSSIAATGGTAGLSLYAASKAALDALIRPLALEVGAAGIRVNNVSPGVTVTDMTAGLPQAARDFFGRHAALKRLAQPEEIAALAVWLCSADASYITGQSILADGGFNIAGAR